MSADHHKDQDRGQDDPSTPLLSGRRHGNARGREQKFPLLRARIIVVLTPMLLGSAAVSRDSLMAQYLVDRFGHNSTQSEANRCQSGNSSHGVRDPEAQAAELLSQWALFQTIPACIACLVFGSYSDFLGRRTLLLIPMSMNLLRSALTSLVIGLRLPLAYMYLAYVVDGIAGSWFSVLIAMYSITADINQTPRSRTFSIFAILCMTSIAQAGVSVASGDLISTLGFLDASLLVTAIMAASFVLPLFLLPETLNYQRDFYQGTEDTSTLIQNENIQEPIQEPDPPPDATADVPAESWINPTRHLRRMFGFYVCDGSIRRRAEMCIFLLIFMFPVANEINIGSIDSLYQLHRPFCWGPRHIGYYSAIRSAGPNFLGAAWLAILQKCIPFEVLGMMGTLFQAGALGFEAFIQQSWQFYLVPVLMIPAVSVSAIVRSLMSMNAKPHQQGALFSSIAVVESLCTMVSTPVYNQVYSATVDHVMPGLIYLVMASSALVAFCLYIAYFLVRKKAVVEISIEEEISTPACVEQA